MKKALFRVMEFFLPCILFKLFITFDTFFI